MRLKPILNIHWRVSGLLTMGLCLLSASPLHAISVDEALIQSASSAVSGDLDTARAVLVAASQQASATPDRVRLAAALGHLFYQCGELRRAAPLIQYASQGIWPAPERSRIHAELRFSLAAGTPQRIYPRSYEAQPLLTRARDALRQSQWDAAWTAFDTVVTAFPNVLIPQGTDGFRGATASVEDQIRSLDEAGKTAYRNFASARIGAASALVTRDDFLNALRRFPHPVLNAGWWKQLGDLLLDRGDYAGAEGAYLRAGETARDKIIKAQTLRVQHVESRREGSGIKQYHPATRNSADLLPGLADPPGQAASVYDLLHSGNADLASEPVCVDASAGMAFLSNGNTLTGVSLADSAWRFRVRSPEVVPGRTRTSFERGDRTYFRSAAAEECVSEDGIVIWRAEQRGEPALVIALDAWDGTLLWTSDDNPDLRSVRIVGGPILKHGIVILSAVDLGRLGEYIVLGVEARTGALLWKTLVFSGQGSVFATGYGELDAGFSGPALAADDTRVYWLTHMGCIASLDLQLGRLEWVTRYDNLVRVGPERDFPLPFIHKRTEPPVLTANEVVCAPRDANEVLVLSKQSGVVLNRVLLLSLKSLIGASGDRFIVQTGPATLVAYPLNGSQILWQRRLEKDIIGTGWLDNDRVWIRSGDQIVSLDMAGGNIQTTEALPPEYSITKTSSQIQSPPPPVIQQKSNSVASLRCVRVADEVTDRIVSSSSALLIEGPFRLDCRQPQPPYALLWQQRIPGRSLALTASEKQVFWMSATRLLAYDLKTGVLQWDVSNHEIAGGSDIPMFRQLLTGPGGTIIITDRHALTAINPQNGAVLHRQFWPAPWELASAFHETRLGVLIRRDVPAPPVIIRDDEDRPRIRPAGLVSPASPPYVAWLDPANFKEISRQSLLYPDGLDKPAVFNRADFSGKNIDDPLALGELRLRCVAPMALNLAGRSGETIVLCDRGLARIHEGQGTLQWWPFRRPVPAHASIEIMPRSLGVFAWLEGTARLWIAGATGIQTHEFSVPFTINEDILYRNVPDRYPVLTAFNLETGGVIWSVTGPEASMDFGVLAVSEGALLQHIRERESDKDWLVRRNRQTGAEMDRTLLPIPDPEAIETLSRGCFIYRWEGGAFYTIDQPAFDETWNISPAGSARALTAQSLRERSMVQTLSSAQVVSSTGMTDLHVDGAVNEWPENWTDITAKEGWVPMKSIVGTGIPMSPSEEDLSARVAMSEYNNAIAMAVVVHDDTHSAPGSLAFGDCIEVTLRNPANQIREERGSLVRFQLGLVRGIPRVEYAGYSLEPPAFFDPWELVPLLRESRGLPRNLLSALAISGATESLLFDANALLVGIQRNPEKRETSYEFTLSKLWLSSGRVKDSMSSDKIEVRILINDNDGAGLKGRLEWPPSLTFRERT